MGLASQEQTGRDEMQPGAVLGSTREGGARRIIRELIGKRLCSQKRAGLNGFAHVLSHISAAMCSARVGSTCGACGGLRRRWRAGTVLLGNETWCGCRSRTCPRLPRNVFLHAESIRVGFFSHSMSTKRRGKNTNTLKHKEGKNLAF